MRRQEELRKKMQEDEEKKNRGARDGQSGRRNRSDYATPNRRFAMISKKATIVSASSFKICGSERPERPAIRGLQ